MSDVARSQQLCRARRAAICAVLGAAAALSACAPRQDGAAGLAWWRPAPAPAAAAAVAEATPPVPLPPVAPQPAYRQGSRADVKALRAMLERRQRKPATRPATAIARLDLDWPLQGLVLVQFGERPNGIRKDGIDIAAQPGAEVRAVERGRVIYAGNELSGYGALVLIQHEGGLTTVYGNNRQLKVRPGEEVARGQVVAQLGEDAGISPHLFFQVRADGKPVDPRRYLARRPTLMASVEAR